LCVATALKGFFEGDAFHVGHFPTGDNPTTPAFKLGLLKEGWQIEKPINAIKFSERTLFRIIRGAFTERAIKSLLDSTQVLEKKTITKNKGERTKRGDEQVLHLGYWRKYANKASNTLDMEREGVRHWIEVNNEVWMEVNRYFRLYFEHLHHIFR